MPRDSATGVFTLLENSNYPAVPATKITSAAHNAQMDDLEAALNTEPFIQATGGETPRSANERGRETMSMLDFVTDARGGATRRAAILAGTSPGDDGPAVAAAVAWANAAPTMRMLWVPGGFICTTDIPNFADVQMFGPGYIKLGSGANWYVNPNPRNTGFSPLGKNTIYLSASTGNDANSGLSSTYPVATMQAAIDRFEGFLSGYFRITILDGVFREQSTFNKVQSSRAGQFEVVGATPASTWNNTSPPTEPVSISAITSTNPAVITAAGHSRSIGQKVMIYDAVAAASAEHGSVAQIFTITNVAGNDLTVNADGSGWAAYVGSGKLIDMNGSSPQVVFFGDKDTSKYAINQDSDDYVSYFNIMGVNWGTKTTTVNQNAGLITVSGGGKAILDNVHCYNSGNRLVVRTGSEGNTEAGGYVYNCGNGDWSVGGSGSFGGPANPGTLTNTGATLYHKCYFAANLWDGASFHLDGCIIKDCSNIANVYAAGSHLVSYYVTLINTTGSPLGGYVLSSGGDLNWSNGLTSSVTGTFQPLVDRRDGNLVTQNISRQTWQGVTHYQNSTITPGAGEVTILSASIPRCSMNAFPQGFWVQARGTGTWANDALLVRIKLNGTAIYTRTEALNASGREVCWEFDTHANGFNVARLMFIGRELIGSTVTSKFDLSSPAFDTTTADNTLTVTIEILNAADSFALTYSVMEFYGC